MSAKCVSTRIFRINEKCVNKTKKLLKICCQKKGKSAREKIETQFRVRAFENKFVVASL